MVFDHGEPPRKEFPCDLKDKEMQTSFSKLNMPLYHPSKVIGAAWNNRKKLNREFQSHHGFV